MSDLTPTFTSIPLLPPVPRFLAELLSPAEEQTEQEPRGGIPSISMGERLPVEMLTPGYYVCPVRGEGKRAYGDYQRIGDLKGPSFAPEQLVDRPDRPNRSDQ